MALVACIRQHRSVSFEAASLLRKKLRSKNIATSCTAKTVLLVRILQQKSSYPHNFKILRLYKHVNKMTQESVQKLSSGSERFSILLRPTHQNTSNDMIAASFREKKESYK